MRRAVVIASGLIFMGWCCFVAVAPASAFPLTTCTLTVTSTGASGEPLDTAQGGGAGGTRDDPLLVDPNGSVTWTGTTGGASIAGGSYHVEVFGVPTPLRGSTGDGGTTSGLGGVDLGEILPFDLAGLVYVSGAIDVGGSPVCSGSGWIKLTGDPVGTPGFAGGVGLSLIGVATVLASVRGRHPFRGAIGGLLGGAGLALLSGVTGVLPLDEATPIAEVISAVILGLVLGVIDFGSLFRGGTVNAVRQAEVPEAGSTSTIPTTEPQPATTPVPPIVPPPVAVSPASAPAPAPATRPPGPGLAPIRLAIAGMPRAVKAEVVPLLQRGETILRTGPGTLTIGADVIQKVLAAAEGAPQVSLANGTIDAEGGKVKVTPEVEDGKVKLSFLSGDSAEAFVLGFAAEVASAAGSSAFDGLNTFLDHLNRAVADAGQRITAVTVDPSGIAVTTGPATR